MKLTVPGYDVDDLIGYGSHGQVWSGRVTGTDKPVALKRIGIDSDVTARAARAEAALLAALNHPNLIALREFVVIDSAVVLALELAEGGSLADLIRRRDRLTPAEVVASLSPIAAALAYAHDEGVLHGDISAANILFTGDGQPKLADLGVARVLGSETEAIGTPAYVDPSVAAGGAVGAASDVFSLAAVALHALTGAGPWQGSGDSTAEEVLATAASGVIADLPQRLAVCPGEMAAVLMRALDPEPHLRGSAADFALDLRACAQAAAVALSAGRLPVVGPPVVGPPVVARPVGGRPVGGRPVGVWPVGGRHAAVRRGQAVDSCGMVDAKPADGGPFVTPGRPGFARPQPAERDVIRADLTRVARPQVRPPIVAEPGRGRRMIAAMRRPWFVLLAGILLLAAVLSAVAVSGALPGRSSPAQTDAGRLLQGLDDLRVQAFAHRQPALLEQVYVSPTLLAQDVAQIQTRVPEGCVLVGLKTSYRQLRVISRTPTRIEVSGTITLSAAELRCAGQVRGRTSPAGPTPVRVVLSATPDGGFAIASQQIGVA